MREFDEQIEVIVQAIWSTLVDVAIQPGGDGAGPSDASTVTGIINVDGAWHGAVLVRCPLALASLVTAAMFQGDEDPTFEEVCDALGELTNIVAGNVKALLPQPSSISLPTVALGSQYKISVVGTRIVATVPFTCASHPLVVSVVQRSEDVEGGADDDG
jgi:chemotaxis protein CheX